MMLCCLPDDIFNHICSYIDYPEHLHSSTTTCLPLKFTCKALLFDKSILSSNFNPRLFKRLFKFSIFFGNLDLLTWSYSFVGRYKKKHVWNEDACSIAASRGHLEVLKYLHQNGCPWNKQACSDAAYRGHLEVLKYLHQNGCPWNEQACLRIAKKDGHLTVVEWITLCRKNLSNQESFWRAF